MNILFLNSSRKWGGNEHWTRLAMQSLGPRHEVHVAYRSTGVGRRFPGQGHRLPFLGEADPISLVRLARLISVQAIDVIIPTKRRDYALAGLSALGRRTANIIRQGIVRHLADNPINRLVYNRLCDGIMVNSTAARQALISAGVVGGARVRVIYNGIDFAAVETASRARVQIELPFDFVAVAMGELSERKGFDLLLRGLSRFLADHDPPPRIGLVLLGEGREADGLRRLAAELAIQDRVVFAGFQDNPYPYLARGDVFIMTSKNEGIPNAMLEAMALKIPVITSGFPGAEEVIAHGENGLITRNDDPGELAVHLRSLVESDGRRKDLGEAGRETVRSRFTLERMGAEIEEMCRLAGGPY